MANIRANIPPDMTDRLQQVADSICTGVSGTSLFRIATSDGSPFTALLGTYQANINVNELHAALVAESLRLTATTTPSLSNKSSSFSMNRLEVTKKGDVQLVLGCPSSNDDNFCRLCALARIGQGFGGCRFLPVTSRPLSS